MTASAESSASALEQEILARPVEERDAVRAFFAANPPGEGAPIAVVIPAYNEEPTVADVVREIPAEAAGLAAEVIVVVDGARDATAREALSAG
ncbi:MAG TPA: glycosyltransferase, partial [Solirubrobacteraceae bacterium]|nr:glycosyltransferase [Solirubrobacteraceae bacterium]